MAVQKVFIPILNFIYNRTSWMSHRTRTVLMYACLTIIIVSTYFYQAKRFFLYDYPAMLNSLIGVCAFAGFLIVSVDRKIEPVKLRSWLLYVLMLCGLVIMISGLHHYIGYSYILLGFFMTFLMPACIIVLGNTKKFNDLFFAVSVISCVCFCIYFIINAIVAPIGTTIASYRYYGIANDPNGVAKSSVISCVCAIYLFFQIKSRLRVVIVPIISMSIGLALITLSRANLLALIMLLFFVCVMMAKQFYLKTNSKKILKTLVVCGIIILLIPVSMDVMNLNNPLLEKDSTNKSVDVSDNNTQVKTEQPPEHDQPRINVLLQNRSKQGQLSDNSIDLNDASSGRLDIWKYCLNNLNLFGNNVENGAVKTSGGGVNYHAHNTVLELTLRSGMLAGLCFLIIEIICAVWVIKTVFFKRTNTTGELFVIMTFTAFGIASLFDIAVLPFAKQTVILFYLCLPYLMINCSEDIMREVDEIL